ncbi:MAG: hypothetical protein M3R55_10535 [Acidobacteriota bacterium]|nr:hypothetical protein [Acidobacteriota bacterium]
MSAPVIAIMMKRAERAIVAELRGAGALSPDRAIPLDPGDWIRRTRIKAMSHAGVLRPGSREGHYLDEDNWRQYEDARRKRSLFIVGLSLLLLLLGYVLLRS